MAIKATFKNNPINTLHISNCEMCASDPKVSAKTTKRILDNHITERNGNKYRPTSVKGLNNGRASFILVK